MNETYALSTFDNETCFNCLSQIYFLFAFNCEEQINILKNVPDAR